MNNETTTSFKITDTSTPDILSIRGADGDLLVTVRPNGALEYGKNYTPSAAAQSFWDCMRSYAPTNQMVATLDKMIDVQCSFGNYNCNEYMWGLANGMILARAIMTDQEPEYLDKPGEWLDDRESVEYDISSAMAKNIADEIDEQVIDDICKSANQAIESDFDKAMKGIE